MIARISGYGQTGPYAPRAGFASVSEAMGGVRYINGFPGEPPPRMHISLGDSLAGMYAAQGILAALYKRDALGFEKGQVIDVSLLEASFSLLESTVPEYDRLGIVRGPGGTGLKGVAPSNIFKSRDDKWIVIAANADGVFRRLCEAMGQAELADDARFSTHLARGDHQEEIEGIVAEWAGARDASEIDRVLNEAGVICGPIYTIADIFEDEHYRARDMLLEHDDPEFGPYLGPGLVPKFSETPSELRWSATVGGGKSQRGRLLRPARPVPRSDLADLNGRRRDLAAVTRRNGMAYRLGVDVGGTFTDLLLVHDESGSMHRVKTPSTPADPSEGVLVGVKRIAETAGADVGGHPQHPAWDDGGDERGAGVEGRARRPVDDDRASSRSCTWRARRRRGRSRAGSS